MSARTTRAWQAIAAALLLHATGCAGGGAIDPGTCKIEALRVEEYKVRPGQAKIGYRVRGTSGVAAVTSLVAKLGSERYITGPGVKVGPGAFEAIVDIDLTGLPPELLVMLEVGNGKRCTDKAKLPS